MDFSIRLEIILLIVIIFLIMSGHVLCSCCKVGLMEGFAAIEEASNSFRRHKKKVSFTPNSDKSMAANAASYKEGFVSSSQFGNLVGVQYPLNNGQSAPYSLKHNKPINTDSWFTADLTSKNGKDGGKGIQDIMNRPKQPIPLPEGEMLLLANTKFSPECCPNAFSTSSGCACMTVDQYNYLIDRGGNNIPYSEY